MCETNSITMKELEISKKDIRRAIRFFLNDIRYDNRNIYQLMEANIFFADDLTMEEIIDKIWCHNINLDTIKKVNMFKKFKIEEPEKGSFTKLSFIKSNTTNMELIMNDFFSAELPILLLGYIWCDKIGRQIDSLLPKSVFANRLSDPKSSSINKLYIEQYTKYRNGAMDILYDATNTSQGFISFHIDISRYFYNINFDMLKNRLEKFIDQKKISNNSMLTNVILKIIKAYMKLDGNLYNINSSLPIGFLPSSVLSNLFLVDIDENFAHSNPSFYGRYVDDMTLVYPFREGCEKLEDYTHIANTEIFNSINLKTNSRCVKKIEFQPDKSITFIVGERTDRNYIDKYREIITSYSSDFYKIANLYDMKNEISKTYEIEFSKATTSTDLAKIKKNITKLKSTISVFYYNIILLIEDEVHSKVQIEAIKNEFLNIINCLDDRSIIELYDYWHKILIIENFLETNNFRQRIREICSGKKELLIFHLESCEELVNNLFCSNKNAKFNIIKAAIMPNIIIPYDIMPQKNYIKKMCEFSGFLKGDLNEIFVISDKILPFDNSPKYLHTDNIKIDESYNVGVSSMKMYNNYYQKFLDNELSFKYYKFMYEQTSELLNSAIKANVDLLILPEHAIPLGNLTLIIQRAIKSKIMIIGGLIPIRVGRVIYNILVHIIPYKKVTNGVEEYDAEVYFSHKNYPSLQEVEAVDAFKNDTYSLYNVEKKNVVCFKLSKYINIVPYNCFDFYNSTLRYKHKGDASLLTVSVNNRDTKSFNNIIGATRNDMMCYIVQSNYQEFGDTMISLPKGKYEDVPASIKGGGTHLLTHNLNFKELHKAIRNEKFRKKNNYKCPPMDLLDKL